ncbi:MAG: hypothetical protein KJZ93_20655 [Caldilineaceae bacterium]|nr:hypothetical protein [Caldilineaceae bacterium]
MQYRVSVDDKRQFVRFVTLLLAILWPLALVGGSVAAEGVEPAAVQAPLGAAFTYQGQLKRDGGLFDGSCNFQFTLWDEERDGAQQGDSQSLADLAVLNGLFTAQLDFGNQFTGDARWLEVQVQCEDDEEYTTLAPRILLTSSPYAIGLMPGAQIEGAVNSVSGVVRVVNHGVGTAVLGVAVPSEGATYGILGNAFSPNGIAVSGYTENGGTAVRGLANDSGVGVWGSSNTGAGVYGESANFNGVRGLAHNPNHGAIVGIHDGGGWAVFGTSDSGAGVVGLSKTWVGVYGESESAFGVQGKSGSGSGVVGTSTAWIGVYGESTQYEGVRGLAHNANHGGVVGIHNGGGIAVFGNSPTGDGVYGTTAAGNKAGVVGVNTGNGNGVYGRSNGGGFAGFFEGKVGSRTVHILGGADLAEWYNVTGAVEPGTLMVIDPENAGHLMPSTQAYDTKVAGIVSGAGGVNPGLTLQQEGVLDGDTQVAIAGRVYVQAEAFSAPIQPGDLLTTSDIPGHAMKAVDRDRSYGAVIGKAMTGLDEGAGLVLVLVNLQ